MGGGDIVIGRLWYVVFVSEERARRFQQFLQRPMISGFGILIALIILNKMFIPFVFYPAWVRLFAAA